MKSVKLGIGIIGCGKAGRYHSYWYSKNADCRLIGFYNRTKLKAVELSKKYDAEVYDEWEELVKDPRINIVSICTPVFQHVDQACFALDLKKHVVCEKPMACNSDECRKMIKSSKKSRTALGLFFNMRFNPVVEAVNKNISNIGELVSIDINFQFNRSDLGWRGEPDSSTGVLMELGTHAIDLALCWFKDIEKVKAEIGNFMPSSSCNNHAYVIFKFKNGSIGKLYTSYIDPGLYDEQIEGLIIQILGRKGKICLLLNSYDPKRNRVFIIKDTKKEEILIEKPGDYDEIYPGHMDSFGKLINKFISSVIEKKKFEPSGIAGLKTIKFVEDAFKSSKWR